MAPSLLPPFQRLVLSAQVAEGIRNAIATQRFVSELPSERRLCALYRASRPVVREALHRLAKEGLLEIRRGLCARIRTENPAIPAGPARALLLLGEESGQLSRWQLMLIDELKRELQGRGIAMEVLMEPVLSRRASPRHLRRIEEESTADYWILGGVSEDVQRYFENRPHPSRRVVIMGNAFPQTQLPFVNDDLRGTTRHAAGIFRALGHRHITFIMRARRGAGEADEEAGFLSAFEADKQNTARVVKHDGTVATIRPRLERLFARSPAPTALLVSHAEDTLTVLSWLQGRGLHIPQDVSLIAYQWSDALARLLPTPAWYTSSPREHARKLCRLLLQPQSSKNRSARVLPVFHRNETIAPPGQS